jgi:hypothetical protein
MRDRGLTLDHALGDAVHLVTIWGLGPFGIEASLEGDTLPAIQSTAHRASVNRSVLTCVPAGRIGVEGHTRDICQSPTVCVMASAGWGDRVISSASPHPGHRPRPRLGHRMPRGLEPAR